MSVLRSHTLVQRFHTWLNRCKQGCIYSSMRNPFENFSFKKAKNTQKAYNEKFIIKIMKNEPQNKGVVCF